MDIGELMMSTANNPENTVDYLCLLPKELWRQILLEVYPPLLSTFTENIGEYMQLKWLKERVFAAQKCRIELLVICKALQPIAVELLYSEVILSGTTRGIQKFFSGIDAQCNAGYSPGVYTRSIVVDLRGYERTMTESMRNDYVRLHLLHQYCPRINLMLVNGPFRPYTRLPLDWIVAVETLILFGPIVDWKELPSPLLSHSFMRVTSLGIVEPLIFPNLTSLYLDVSIPEKLSLLSLPSLHWLNFSIDCLDINESATFIEQNGQHLRYLGVRLDLVDDIGAWEEPDVKSIINAAYKCHHLDVLEIDSRLPDTGQPRDRHPSLHTLILQGHDVPTILTALYQWGFQEWRHEEIGFHTVVINFYGDIGQLMGDDVEAAILEEIIVQCDTKSAVFKIELIV